MTKLLEVMAYHGWGFAPPCWQDWQTQFLALGQCQWHSYDRGYWGNSPGETRRERQTPRFSTTDSHKILLTHSYGLHWCIADLGLSGLLSDIDLLVIFGGFQSFHPSDPKAKRRSQRVLRQMLTQLEQNPLTVLHQFYQNCDYPEASKDIRMETLDHALLRSDLQALDQAQLDVTPLSQIPRIVMFQGLQDRIVPVTQAEQLLEQVQFSRGDAARFSGGDAARTRSSGGCQYIPLAAGHALPFTHWEACWSILQPVLSVLRAV